MLKKQQTQGFFMQSGKAEGEMNTFGQKALSLQDPYINPFLHIRQLLYNRTNGIYTFFCSLQITNWLSCPILKMDKLRLFPKSTGNYVTKSQDSNPRCPIPGPKMLTSRLHSFYNPLKKTWMNLETRDLVPKTTSFLLGNFFSSYSLYEIKRLARRFLRSLHNSKLVILIWKNMYSFDS